MKIKTIHKLFFYIFWAYLVSIIFANYFGYWDKPHKNQIIPTHLLNTRSAITGEVLNSPAFYEKFYKKRIKFNLKLDAIDNENFSNKQISIFVDCNLNIDYYPAVGDKIKIYSQLEKLEFPNKYTNYLKYQNIYYKIQDNSLGNYFYLGKGSFIRHIFAVVRKSILDKILILYSGISREILPALIVDERSYMTKNTKKFLNSAGLSHITSISGTHIVLVFMCIAIFFKNRKSLFFIILSLSIIWFYSGITGFSPSCVRSCIMLSIVIIANLFDRNSFTVNNLMLTCFLMLVINPRQLFMISFLFSFLGVFSIFYFYNFWKNDVFGMFSKYDISSIQKESIFKKIIFYPKRILVEVFCGTMSAQTLLSPFVVFYFNSLNFTSIFFNLIVVPFVGIMMIFSFVSVIFSYFYFQIFSTLAKFFAFLNTFIITKTFGLSYYFYEKYSLILKKEINYFYLIIILCLILVVPIVKEIKQNKIAFRLYLSWISLLLLNVLIYGVK
jgi:competence protein ComEC